MVIVRAGVREASERELAAGGRIDLVVCDVRMSDGTGFEVLRATRMACGLHGGEPAAFLFLTAFGSVPEAVEAMQRRGGGLPDQAGVV